MRYLKIEFVDIRVESSRKIDQASAGSLKPSRGSYNRGNLQCVKFAGTIIICYLFELAYIFVKIVIAVML